MKKKISLKVIIPVILLTVMNMAICIMNVKSIYKIKYMSDNIINNYERFDQFTQERLAREIEGKMSQTTMINFVGIALFILVAITLCVTLIQTIAKPAKIAKNQLNAIIESINNNEGNLTKRIPVKSHDEVGELIAGINSFMERLQVIITKTKDGSEGLMLSVEDTLNNIRNSNSDAESVSATMQELAASMEEISDMLQSLADNSVELVNAVNEMNTEADNGTEFVEQIKFRANDIHNNTNERKAETDGMVGEIRTLLQKAVEESQSVEQINDLTNDILDISGQTNLLALNASIEAARAGEAGKGFSVVADEIRVLADNSRVTANRIQDISKLVTNAVGELTENSKKMLQFIDEKVINDYSSFVDVAGQYHKDAEQINKILESFTDQAASIGATAKNMNERLDGITITITESAKAINLAAESTGNLVESVMNIEHDTQNNRDVAERLNEEIECFKTV